MMILLILLFFTSTVFLTHQMIELSILLISNLKETDKIALSMFKAPVNWFIVLIILDIFHHLVCLCACCSVNQARFIPHVYTLTIVYHQNLAILCCSFH